MAVSFNRPRFIASILAAIGAIVAKLTFSAWAAPAVKPGLDVPTPDDGTTLVIAASATEAERFYRADSERYRRRGLERPYQAANEPGYDSYDRKIDDLTLTRADSDYFQMYYEDAHDDPIDDCPKDGPNECTICSPVYTRQQLVEAFERGTVIYEYQ